MPSETNNSESADVTTQADKKPSTSIWIRLWPVYVIALGLVAAWQFGLFSYLSIDTLREQNETLQAFVADNLIIAVLAYILIYAAATVFMLPGALWITISGGLLFGLIGGSAVTVAGATLGASTLFFAARTSIGAAFRERAGRFVKRMEAGFRENAISYMFALRLMPVVPFPVANIAPALLGARYRDYAVTTALGIIPGVVAYTWIGASLGATFDAGETENLFDVVKNFFPALLALGVVALLPVAYKKIAGRKAARLEEAAQ
ncbi:TVP38/TMEM64 family protein [Henriciella mobilis]|uniref:TVP38/TMEM64 family membrane protein n=1 Tax=Henriciella mobilis TaxID=2305467 RepID=A0A399R5Z4_9PROT|nr:VTT domain-containing protein [Henriciella mobilis]RIJ14787.1 TVP38/TMEM64 family protein [Henriciella mobilis]RIJ21743.1 TVP38/TMEM64 family protein [Henriciella mobilis]RIJ26758.1 TVP38/TMEM64 family protein [Henriciella mobilis]